MASSRSPVTLCTLVSSESTESTSAGSEIANLREIFGSCYECWFDTIPEYYLDAMDEIGARLLWQNIYGDRLSRSHHQLHTEEGGRIAQVFAFQEVMLNVIGPADDADMEVEAATVAEVTELGDLMDRPPQPLLISEEPHATRFTLDEYLAILAIRRLHELEQLELEEQREQEEQHARRVRRRLSD